MKIFLLLFLIWCNAAISQNAGTVDENTPHRKNEKIKIAPGFTIEADFDPIHQVFWTTFKKLDSAQKGYLVRADFRPHFLMWVASWKYFSIIDENKDGQISKEEMRKFIQKEADSQRKKFIEAWKRFDINKDGLMSKQEASESEFLDSRFDKIDINKDGLLSPQEVINAYAKELEAFI